MRVEGKCVLLLLLAGACAETTPAPEYPGPHACRFVGLESVDSPQYTRQNDQDSIFMLATYTFSEPNVPPPEEPVTVKFQVDRARVSELQSHLESQPDVICTPEPDAHHYRPGVKPFAGTKRSNPPSTAAITGHEPMPASASSATEANPEPTQRPQNQ